MNPSFTNSDQMSRAIYRVGTAHEMMRHVIGYWPFRRGVTRIPVLLGNIFSNLNKVGVVSGMGAGDVLVPFESGDLSKPAYWFLYEKNVRRLMRRMLAPGSGFIDVGAHNGWH